MVGVAQSDPDALVTSQRTVACLRAALGGTHSNTAQALFNLGNVAATQVCMSLVLLWPCGQHDRVTLLSRRTTLWRLSRTAALWTHSA